MKATSTLLPSASSPLSVELPSASTSPCSDDLALADDRLLVDERALVGARELVQLVVLELALRVLDDDVVGVDRGHGARRCG